MFLSKLGRMGSSFGSGSQNLKENSGAAHPVSASPTNFVWRGNFNVRPSEHRTSSEARIPAVDFDTQIFEKFVWIQGPLHEQRLNWKSKRIWSSNSLENLQLPTFFAVSCRKTTLLAFIPSPATQWITNLYITYVVVKFQTISSTPESTTPLDSSSVVAVLRCDHIK